MKKGRKTPTKANTTAGPKGGRGLTPRPAPTTAVRPASLDSKMPQDFERQDHESDARAYGRYDLDEGEGEDILLKPVVGSARRNVHKIFPQPRGIRSILPDNLRPRFCGIQAQSCRTRVERIARAAEARLRAPRRGGHEDPSPTKATITCDFSFEQIGFDEP